MECNCVFSTIEVKCSAGVEKNIPEREANCVLAQGPLVVEQSWLSLGECVLFSVLFIGGETAAVDSATRLEKKNDPERAEFRNTNLLAAL